MKCLAADEHPCNNSYDGEWLITCAKEISQKHASAQSQNHYYYYYYYYYYY